MDDTLPVEKSTIIIEVRETEQVVEKWRQRYDPSASNGMPAHVTLLYPFLAPDKIDDAVVGRVSTLVGRHSAFDFTLPEFGTFADNVLFLRPDPTEPFVVLTREIEREFGLQPYGGKYENINPHLTLVQGDDLAVFEAARGEIYPYLPIKARADHVVLMTKQRGSQWCLHSRFALGEVR